jgi:hypothetical protein
MLFLDYYNAPNGAPSPEEEETQEVAQAEQRASSGSHRYGA